MSAQIVQSGIEKTETTWIYMESVPRKHILCCVPCRKLKVTHYTPFNCVNFHFESFRCSAIIYFYHFHMSFDLFRKDAIRIDFSWHSFTSEFTRLCRFLSQTFRFSLIIFKYHATRAFSECDFFVVASAACICSMHTSGMSSVTLHSFS